MLEWLRPLILNTSVYLVHSRVEISQSGSRAFKSNKWNEATQALKLPTLLEGEALASWLELSEEEQQDYKLSKRKLIKKLTPPSFATLNEFHARKLRPGEALSLFTQDLKRLLQLAMPGLENEPKDQLLIHQFLAGLPAATSW